MTLAYPVQSLEERAQLTGRAIFVLGTPDLTRLISTIVEQAGGVHMRFNDKAVLFGTVRSISRRTTAGIVIGNGSEPHAYGKSIRDALVQLGTDPRNILLYAQSPYKDFEKDGIQWLAKRPLAYKDLVQRLLPALELVSRSYA